jgi:glycosyltransferase involved in cell wall biosynthesis
MTEPTRRAKRIIFIGALNEHKRIESFYRTIPLIFARTPIEEFWIVGSGKDYSVIQALEAQYPGKITHIPFLERDRCLALMSESLFGYTPAMWGSWGFIGDCWAVGTPVIVTSNHYNFNDDVDAIVATDDEIVSRLNELIQKPAAYQRIAENARKRFLADHSAIGISAKFIEVCRCVLQSA